MDQQAAFDARLSQVERRVDQHDDHLARLDGDMSEIRSEMADMKASLKNMATKEDVAGLQKHFDEKVIGMLQDVLNSMPMKQSLFWGGVIAIIAILGYLHGAR